MRFALLLVLVTVFSSPSHAADHIVDFDDQADFSAVRTFALRGKSIRIDRPEINNPLVQDRINASVREALLERGLEEVAGNADVIVDWTVSGQRFAINQWGHAIPLDDVPGERRAPPGNPWRHLPEAFVDGVLVVDLTAQASGLLVWRGVMRNRERGSARLAHRLPDYVPRLLAGYPPRTK
jgi:hypothetical protein